MASFLEFFQGIFYLLVSQTVYDGVQLWDSQLHRTRTPPYLGPASSQHRSGDMQRDQGHRRESLWSNERHRYWKLLSTLGLSGSSWQQPWCSHRKPRQQELMSWTSEVTPWLRKGLKQDKTSKGGRSQKKWWLTRSPQNWSPDTDLVCTSQVRRPPVYAATAIRTQTGASRGLRRAKGCRAARGGEPIVRHGCQEAALRVPIPMKKKNWAAQPMREMVFCSLKKSQSVLGAMEEVYERSMKGKLPRKKYMGEWRCDSTAIRTIRPSFHTRVMKKIPRNRLKRMTWSSGCSENPKRMKCVIRLMFWPRANSLLSAAFRAPCDSWGNENPGKETIWFCHGILDPNSEPEETVKGKCLTSTQCRNPLYSICWVFPKDYHHPHLICLCKSDRPQNRLPCLHYLDHHLHCPHHSFIKGSYS